MIIILFLGNQKAVNLLNRILEKGSFSQAYIFHGPENVGKFTLAKMFAKSLILEKNSLSETGGKTLLDLICVSPRTEEKKGIIKEKEISVEQIREAQEALALFPVSGKFKVLIIENASRMSASSQNALLKSLEEPNPTSTIILVAHEFSKILPTIKSRCQKINFFLAKLGEIEKHSSKSGAGNPEEIALFSLGRPGLAFDIIGKKEDMEEKRENIKQFRNIFKMNISEKFSIAEEMSKNVPQALKKMELWIWIIHQSLAREKYSKIDNFRIIERIKKSAETLKNTNANAKLVLENLFLDLR